MTESEKHICDLVIELTGKDKSKFGVEERSSSYLTLVYCDNDFFRVKYSDKSKWISIRLANEDKNKDDIRFDAQTNKNQLHWKANINSYEDIYKFKTELINACKSFNSNEYEPRDINHGSITLDVNELLKQMQNERKD